MPCYDVQALGTQTIIPRNVRVRKYVHPFGVLEIWLFLVAICQFYISGTLKSLERPNELFCQKNLSVFSHTLEKEKEEQEEKKELYMGQS